MPWRGCDSAPGSVVFVLTSLGWCLVVRIAGFCLETEVTPSLASQLPQDLWLTAELGTSQPLWELACQRCFFSA